MKKNSRVKIKTGRSLTNYRHRKKWIYFGKINFIYCQLKLTNIMRNKNKNKTPPFFQGSVSLLTLSPTHYPWVVQWDGDGILVNSQYLSLLLLSLHAIPLLQEQRKSMKQPLSQVTDSSKKCAPAQGLYGIHLPSGHIQHNVVTSKACRVGICFGVVLSTGCSGTACLTTVFSVGCRHLDHFLPLLIHCLWCLQGYSSQSSLIQLQPSIFFPVSSMLL